MPLRDIAELAELLFLSSRRAPFWRPLRGLAAVFRSTALRPKEQVHDTNCDVFEALALRRAPYASLEPWQSSSTLRANATPPAD